MEGKTSADCYFSVDEYVLPKFGVDIEGNLLMGISSQLMSPLSLHNINTIIATNQNISRVLKIQNSHLALSS